MTPPAQFSGPWELNFVAWQGGFLGGRAMGVAEPLRPCGWALYGDKAPSAAPLGPPHPSVSPPQGLGFSLVRGPMWGQLCGPRQRGPAVCLPKEEKQHGDY